MKRLIRWDDNTGKAFIGKKLVAKMVYDGFCDWWVNKVTGDKYPDTNRTDTRKAVEKDIRKHMGKEK